MSLISGIHTSLARAANALARLNDVEGMEKLTKFGIAVIEAAALPSLGKLREDLSAQKDLLYGTMFFRNLGEWVTTERDGTRRFAIPRKARGSFVALVIAVMHLGSSFFGMVAVLSKCAIASFPRIAALASEVGSVRLFGVVSLNAIPIVKLLFVQPKDFFVFAASSIEVVRWSIDAVQVWDRDKTAEVWKVDRLAGVISSLGKCILIALGGHVAIAVAITVVDVGTQFAALLKFLLKADEEYQNRLIRLQVA